MEPTTKSWMPKPVRTTILVLFIISAFLGLAMRGYSVKWTGFGGQEDVSVPAKTLWDWMELLLMPTVVAAGALLLKQAVRVAGHRSSEEQAALKREIATDHQQEQALQAYFDRMGELLVKDKLSKFSTEEIRNAARIRTLTVVRGLDSRRKGSVFLFLKDSALIDREAVIDLSGADMRGTSAPFASLKRLNLSEANFSKADLTGSDLSKSFLGGTDLRGANLSGVNLSGAAMFEANLSGANLTRANLSKANLTGADLRGCCLNEADLSEADLSGANLNVGDLVGANLRGANLGKAKLVGADLSKADLSRADLSGTQITPTELEKVKSLEGAILPDGTKHE